MNHGVIIGHDSRRKLMLHICVLVDVYLHDMVNSI